MKAAAIKEQKRAPMTFAQILEGLEGIAIIAGCYLTLFLKHIRDHWGLTKNSAQRFFIGDHIIVEPKSSFVHAVDINAPLEYVWPWMAQIGQGRGGFYSYEMLENLFGLNIFNADTILPQFQNPKVGDLIPFSPNDAYPLVICDEGRAMAIEHCYDFDERSVYDPWVSTPKNYLHLSWLWYVEPLSERRSRFYSRNRVTYGNSLRNKLMFGPLAEPIVFAMDRKMCLGIKKRAELLFQSSDEN